ncbi:hypothetical protein GCM10027275_03020 [Rhabdobacter roseus]|uniref:Tail sheath protein C-terminal domain-containing protein n=1 Tax=Rhabdobacter roseus TaxID=1655419 RepID=A0A840TQ57_9BACT|nr:phage tail sheath C-terminal domain-containing protein [Rhabdobacter roseus]MBB5282190.1 hypothetical protein [Rhabdobacter roseus]
MLDLLQLRTPGVYIDEVPKFPPSVAAVETAIPAFIGYTQEILYQGRDLTGKAVRIESLVEYEEIFGGAPPVRINVVDLDANNAVKTADIAANYYLYDSLRLYFRNGGGKCYIVSTGTYAADGAVSDAPMQAGIDELEREDEPTLMVLPDAVRLPVDKQGDLYKSALAQAEKYKDRFLIADVRMTNLTLDKFVKADIDAFRQNIGMANLQFGAAYYPYLSVNLPRSFHYRDIKGKITKVGVPVAWDSTAFTGGDADAVAAYEALNNVVDSQAALEAKLSTYLGDNSSLETLYRARRAALDTAQSLADVVAKYTELLDFLFEITHKFLDQVAKDTATVKDPILDKLRTAILTPTFLDTYLVPLNNLDQLTQDTTVVKTSLGTLFSANGRTWNYADIKTRLEANAAADKTGYALTNIAGGDNAATKDTKTIANLRALTDKSADQLFGGIIGAINALVAEINVRETALEIEVLRRIPVLNNVLTYLRDRSFLIPPSGAVAGIYARVDRTRGVWKAPANESLANVKAPLALLTHDQHGECNVDSATGKSVNVVRSYPGKGVLVYGARTLAGNDNEWRYVNVRRLFNMIEESCKKATEPFVFEPNDPNTWVKVQAMIENFLTTLWRQGALFGANPDQAFYVLVGLNKTMTALDILEGRMIVEIGVAANRPAEFIVLRFSHKLPEA